MSVLEEWLPPSRENWELVVSVFKYFPLVSTCLENLLRTSLNEPQVTLAQWLPLGQSLYALGKTSGQSRLNIPGKIGWITMEAPGFITLLYIMLTLPSKAGLDTLPWENWAMGTLFTFHYIYRSIIGPLLSPSMSPIHPFVWTFALCFQIANAISIGGWLGGYGYTTRAEWASGYRNSSISGARMELGFMIWALGFVVNVFHDDELREIRRAATRNHEKRAKEAESSTGKGKAAGKPNVDKFYLIPKNGLFWWIFYPHYVAEWVEWAGFWLMGGSQFVPGRTFLINEIATMTPRAIQGKKWYVERFGEEKIAGRKALIPGLI
ncbi:MAG: hypothetical protein M1818_006787 [Claussenomyces sp. TS43310]|nr:MAG: hypothetical protein M1818_006787 [Claussenomyces sp. TS43310]